MILLSNHLNPLTLVYRGWFVFFENWAYLHLYWFVCVCSWISLKCMVLEGGLGTPRSKKNLSLCTSPWHCISSMFWWRRSCRSCRSLKLALTNVAVCRGREWLVDANYWHADAWCEDVSSEVRLPQFKATPPPPEFSIVRAWIDDLSRAIMTHYKSSCVLIFNRWNLLLLMSHSVVEGNGSSMRIINFILGDEAYICS